MSRKIFAMLGAVFALGGCSGADGSMKYDIVDEDAAEVSEAFLVVKNPGPMEPDAEIAFMTPLVNDTTYELTQINAVGEVVPIGFVFASAGTSKGVDHEQRWVLNAGYAPLPKGSFRFVMPAPAHRYTSLAAWTSALTSASGSLWNAGAMYVKVKATVAPYSPTDASGTSSSFLEALYQPQLVDEIGVIYGSGVEGKGNIQGVVSGGPLARGGVIVDGATNTEYWLTGAGYYADTSVAALQLDIGAGSLPLILSQFGEGSTQTVATCTYFTSLPSAL